MSATPAGGLPVLPTGLNVDMVALASGDFRRAQRRVAFDDSPIGIFCTNSAGRIVDANPKCLLMLEYEWSELIGKTLEDITHPDDHWIGLRELSELQMSHGRSYEKRFLTPSGATVWTGLQISRITSGDRQIGLVAMIVDLSDQREAGRASDEKDALVDRVMNSAPMLLFACDEYGLTTHWEGRGVMEADRDQMVGQSIWEIFRDQPEVLARFTACLAGTSGEVGPIGLSVSVASSPSARKRRRTLLTVL